MGHPIAIPYTSSNQCHSSGLGGIEVAPAGIIQSWSAVTLHFPNMNFSKLMPSLICTERVACLPSFHSTVTE